MTPEEKTEIDEMSYYTMLRKWRFQPIGDDYFQGERGQYFTKIMFKKQENLKTGESVAISKSIGW